MLLLESQKEFCHGRDPLDGRRHGQSPTPGASVLNSQAKQP